MRIFGERVNYGRYRFRFLSMQKERILMLLATTCSIKQLLGLLVNTGLLSMAKKVGKILAAQNCDISLLTAERRDELLKLVTRPERAGKSLFIGFCALAVLCARPTVQLSCTEQTQLQQIMLMMEHSFLRPDVVLVFEEWYVLYISFTNPLLSQTKQEFEEMFCTFFDRIGWFNVVMNEIINAPPAPVAPPAPPAPIAQPSII